MLGHQAAHDLFLDGKPLGRLFKVNQVWLRVVGVLADRDLGQNKFEGVALGSESNTVFVSLSSALMYAIAAFAAWQVARAPAGVIASVLVCTLIGLAFSIYPARQAVALDPIAAIRDE